MRAAPRAACLVLVLSAPWMALRAQKSDSTERAEKQRIVHRLLEITNATGIIVTGVEESVAAQRASNPRIPAVAWDRMLAVVREHQAELVDSVAVIYERAFSLEDLRALLKFNESPPGRRITAAMPEVMRQSMLAGQRWGFALGQQIGEQLMREGLVPLTFDTTGAAVSGEGAARTFEMATGTWDWNRGDSTCVGNTHTVSFSDDRSTMLLTFREPIDSSGATVYRYRILGSGPGVLSGVPHVVRAAMEGETRTTDTGALVVWDLVLATPNRYHWHRTDWPNGHGTDAVLRCDGAHPVERAPDPSDFR